MYWKMAFRNVRKSYQDFFLYFMTLLFSVCLFYTFNSFQAQKEMMVLSESQDMLMQTTHIFMMVLSLFVINILAALILYANRFLIRRRKKEFGLYLLLGMPVKAISRILVYEVLFIGLISLILGLCMGFGLSQLFAIVTARVIQVEVDFHVVFSYDAAWFTILCFGMIFLLTMWRNVRMIHKQKLIELLYALNQQEKQRLHSFPLSIVLFVTSLLLLSVTYYLAVSSVVSFGQFFIVILLLGASGTLLFFFSLTGFLLRFIEKSGKLYYHGLNMFALRQIHSRINSNFISMSIVCLMLLLSIGALATGWNMNLGVSDMYRVSSPYDISYIQYLPQESIALFVNEADVRRQAVLQVYEGDVTYHDLYRAMGETKELKQSLDYPIAMPMIPYSQYVTFCEQKGIAALSLKEDEIILFAPQSAIVDSLAAYLKDDARIEMMGKSLHIADEVLYLQPYTDMRKLNSVMGIVADTVLTEAVMVQEIRNYDIKEHVDLDEFQKTLDEQLLTGVWNRWHTFTKTEVYEDSASLGLLFTYIGLYLGIVFLLASAAILALQQLSEADYNRQRYEILQKIGVEKKMMNHAVMLQIGIYFLLPLLLAMVHSYFGIRAVGAGFAMIIGSGTIVSASLVSALCIIAIYGIYFLMTVKGYQRILYQKG